MNSSSNFPFLCKMLGTCCIHNQVVLNPFDIHQMARALDVPSKFLFSKKIITYRFNQTEMWMEPILQLRNEICPFLIYKSETQKVCDIHEFRPTVCRIFPLNLNIKNSSFSIPDSARERCKKCFETERVIKIENFIYESNLTDRLKYHQYYMDLKNELIESGFTIKGIKGNPSKRKKFFKIQEILYEKYPISQEESFEFLWEEILLEIKDVIEID